MPTLIGGNSKVASFPKEMAPLKSWLVNRNPCNGSAVIPT